MRFGYHLGSGRGLDPKVEAQSGEEQDFYPRNTEEEAGIQNWAMVENIWVPWDV